MYFPKTRFKNSLNCLLNLLKQLNLLAGQALYEGKANCLEMILNSSLDHATKTANKNPNLIIWLCFKV